jgi:hypothetical protein
LGENFFGGRRRYYKVFDLLIVNALSIISITSLGKDYTLGVTGGNGLDFFG